MIRLEIDWFNRKARQKLEAENLILKQQIANYRNTILELRMTKQATLHGGTYEKQNRPMENI